MTQRWWSFVRKSFSDAKNDILRVFPHPKHYIAVLLMLSLLGGIIMAFIFLEGYFRPGRTDTACSFQEFILSADQASPWTTAGLVQITLSFGKLSFAQVKGIDIAWDMVCFWGIPPQRPID